MLFVLVALGLYKLYECRNPDNVPHTHWLLLTMSLLILLIGVGVVSELKILIINIHIKSPFVLMFRYILPMSGST